MSKKFITSLLLMILLNVIIKPVWIFGVDRQVQLHVGQMEYGEYFALLNLSFIFNILLDIGITGYANRTIAADHSRLSTLTYQSFIAKLFFSVIYIVIIFSVALLSGVKDFKLVFLLSFVQVLTSFLLWGRGLVSALQQFKADAWLSVSDKALLIILAGGWLYLPIIKKTFTIYDFAWLQVITTAVTLLVCFYFLYRQPLFGFSKRGNWSVKKVIQESWPYAATVFFMGVHNRTDGFLLERLGTNGSHEAGVYAAAYRLLDAANMIGYLFATILVSYWAKHAGEKPVIQKSLTFSHQLLIPAGILAAVTVFILNRPLYHLLYHHNDAYAETILKWCLLGIVPFFVTHIYGTLLTAIGKIKILMRLVFIFAAVNVTANIFLIPVYGAMASVYIALVTQTGLAFCTVITCTRQTHIKVASMLWGKYLLIAIISILLLLFMGNYNFSVWLKLAAITAVWLILMNVLHIFSIRSFLKLMREN